MSRNLVPQDAAIRSLALCSCNLEGTKGGWAVGVLVRRTLALMELCLDGNNDFGASSLGAPGINVAALAHALPSPLEGQTLRSLSLNNLNLSSVAGGKAVAAVLHRTPSLKHLTLCSNNGLKAVGIEALLEGSPAALIIECLQLRDCGLEGAAAGRAVAAFAAKSSHLRQLDLGKNSNFCCQGLAGFLEECMCCASLTELDLCNCGLRGPEVDPIVAILLSRFSAVQMFLRHRFLIPTHISASKNTNLYPNCTKKDFQWGPNKYAKSIKSTSGPRG